MSGMSDEERGRNLLASKAPKLSYLKLGTRMEGESKVCIRMLSGLSEDSWLFSILDPVQQSWSITDSVQGSMMLEAKRAAGMSTFRESREAKGELGDEEKGKVGSNRAWYPG